MSFVALQVFFAVNGGRNTLICLETVTKMGMGAKTRIKGNLGYVKFGGLKKGRSPFDSFFDEIFLEGYAHFLMEGGGKSPSGKPCNLSGGLKGNLFSEVIIYVSYGFHKTAKLLLFITICLKAV